MEVTQPESHGESQCAVSSLSRLQIIFLARSSRKEKVNLNLPRVVAGVSLHGIDLSWGMGQRAGHPGPGALWVLGAGEQEWKVSAHLLSPVYSLPQASSACLCLSSVFFCWVPLMSPFSQLLSVHV